MRSFFYAWFRERFSILTAARKRVTVWHLVERYITEASAFSKWCSVTKDKITGFLESMGHPLGQSRAFLHCNIPLIEYYHGHTDFNGNSSLSKNNISHLEIIKMRWPEITDTLSSQKEPNFFFFPHRRENPTNTCEFIYQVTCVSFAWQKN